MKMDHHQTLLRRVKENSGTPTKHTFADHYLGNSNLRYPINTPQLRKLARAWIRANRSLTAMEFDRLLTQLIEAPSSTEKSLAGILLGYLNAEQRKFNPARFDHWLDHLTGWAEVDAVCSGKYMALEIPENPEFWKKTLTRFSKSKNIHKRRASIVMLVSPFHSGRHDALAELALANVDRLKHEKEILITKAISWVLRSLIKHHRKLVRDYVRKNRHSLPAIAVRETLIKLKTGRKNG
jgi:3-methyladenine DNA glycosylase AlkD